MLRRILKITGLGNRRRKTLKINVAVIDDLINIDYLKLSKASKIEIKGVFSILNNRVEKCEPVKECLTHATLCTKIFNDKVKYICGVYFINIFDVNDNRANIDKLLVALEWCKVQKIKIVNLSLGTTKLKDIDKLYKKIVEVSKENMIVVAANSNDGKMTFPASFDKVISVNALKSKNRGNRLLFHENDIDGINIESYVKKENVIYNNMIYKIYPSNSYAAPIITAKFCEYFSQGFIDVKQIKEKIMAEAIITNESKQLQKLKKNYCKKLNIPIIAVVPKKNDKMTMKEDFVLIDKLLQNFSQNGYEGICITDTYEMNINKRIFNLEENKDINKLNTKKKMKFWGNYCNTDFIIVYIKSKKEFYKIVNRYIDVILHNGDKNMFDVYKYKYVKKIEMENPYNYDNIFECLYTLLIN